jgi:hypothetical protein
MSAFEGLEAEPDGEDRWRIRETGRAGSDGLLGTARGDAEHGYTLEVVDGPAAGPYATLDDALQAVAMWRLARFRGDVG